jgi:hypothetical protein
VSEVGRQHAPKVAALRAEAAGLLSGAGRERLLRHVATCEVCAEHLRGARRFHALVSRATGQPTLDASGTVQRVMVRNRLAQRRARVQWGGLAVAAGVLLALFLGIRDNEQGANERHDASAKHQPAPKAPAAAPQVVSEVLAVAVTALRGEVHVVEPAHPERLLGIDDPVREHSVLRVAERAAVDLALGEAASVHLSGGSEVALDAVRSDHIALRLTRGVISNAVTKRAEGQSYEVLALGHRVAVRGTLFAVRAGGPFGLAVQCDEGSVEVIAPSGETTLLRAPATWNERVIAPAGAAPEPKLQVELPYARRDGSVLTLPAVEGLEGWQVGGQVYPGGDALRMRMPPGAHDLVALLGGDKRHVIKVEVDAIGAQVRPSDLSFAKAPEETAAPSPAAEPAVDVDASSVILAGRPALQRCYERSLKNESSGSHALRLSISIDPRGRVRKVEPASQKPGVALPAELAQCIRTAVQSWHFPAPGGEGITLEAPLRFQLRR